MRRQKHTAVKVISGVLCVLLAVGAVGIAAKFTGGFKRDFSAFYVVHDGKEIHDEAENVVIPQGNLSRFDCKYLFGVNATTKEFSVKVVPNVRSGKDFDFIYGGQVYSFSAEKDLTAGFELERHEGYFLFGVKNWDMSEILSKVLSGPVEVPESVDIKTGSYFTLVISSYDGKREITVDIVSRLAVTGVVIDPGNMEF